MTTKKKSEQSAIQVGDLVRESEAYALANRNKNWYDDQYQRLYGMRYRVIAVEGDEAEIIPNGNANDSYAYKVPLEQLELFPSNAELEEKYAEVVSRVSPAIVECMAVAEAAISEAINLSEKYGVPFIGYATLEQKYVPERLPELDPAVIAEISKVAVRSGDSGWEQSALC